MTTTPWTQLKVAFDINDARTIWDAEDRGPLKLPEGWDLTETDSSGARAVAIFDVDHSPTEAEGLAVRLELHKAEEKMPS